MTKVLYVEDESLLAITMEGAMQRRGFTVELAFDGREGLEQARRFRPEVIVTDYMMPEMDGISMLRALRDEGIDVPAIMTSAVPEDDFRTAERQDFAVYLGKPFEEDELIAAVERLHA